MTRGAITRTLKIERHRIGLLWHLQTIRQAVALAEAAHSVLAMDTTHMPPEAARAVEEIQRRIVAFRQLAEEMD